MIKRLKIVAFVATVVVFRFGRRQVLRVWRCGFVVRVRRRMEAFDQFIFDAVRLWLQLWGEQSKKWPPPHPRWIVRLYRQRRALLKRLREVADKMSVPVRIVGAAQLGKNVLGCYSHGGVLPQISLLDVRQDDPWVLAHELGHHFAITFKGDTRERAADEEARKLVDEAVGIDSSWMRLLAEERLPANGCIRFDLWGGPSIILSLFLVGAVLSVARVSHGGNLMLISFFNLWAFYLFNIGRIQKRVDPLFSQSRHVAYYHAPSAPTKSEIRLEKLRRLRDDPSASRGERQNAATEIARMHSRRNR